MSTAPLAANDKSAWIRDLVYLAFPEGEARERVLFDLVKRIRLSNALCSCAGFSGALEL
jgi:hypothetical protein